ncbi:MAG: hypothetical protein AB7E80_11640 [Hyphomicrobiaceae bacterium]
MDSRFPHLHVEQLQNGKWALVVRAVLDMDNPDYGVLECQNVFDVYNNEAEAMKAMESWLPAGHAH